MIRYAVNLEDDLHFALGPFKFSTVNWMFYNVKQNLKFFV